MLKPKVPPPFAHWSQSRCPVPHGDDDATRSQTVPSWPDGLAWKTGERLLLDARSAKLVPSAPTAAVVSQDAYEPPKLQLNGWRSVAYRRDQPAVGVCAATDPGEARSVAAVA